MNIEEPENSSYDHHKLPILWANDSSSTEENYYEIKEVVERKSLGILENISRMYAERGYVITGGSWAMDDATETYSKTRESLQCNEWDLEIRRLVESGQVTRARRLLLKLGSNKVGIYKLNAWQALLDMPKVSRGGKATGRPISVNTAVLRERSAECQGKWVALQNGSILDSNESKITLYRNLKSKNKLKGTTFIYIEK